MSGPALNVLISGAGIAGPCLAYWLSRTHLDVSITVIERASEPRATGQAIDIRGAAIDIIKKMNMEAEIRARSTTEEGTEFVNGDGKRFAYFAGGETFTAEYEILRADLSELFLEATEKLPNVKFVYGDWITAVEQTSEDVRVTLNSGSQKTFDLLVAADGSGSRTRSMILDQSILQNGYKFIGQYIAYFSIPSLATDDKLWKWYSVPKGLGLMLRPHRNPKTMGAYLIVTTPAHEEYYPDIEDALTQDTAAQKKLMRNYLGGIGWQATRILDGMDDASDFYMSRTATVNIPRWTNNRGVLMGDSAMAAMGVGTSLAIESAYCLAGELSRIKSTMDVPRALECYEKVYRPVRESLGSMPRFYPQAAFPQTGWALWLRNTLIWFVSTSRLYKLSQGGQEKPSTLPPYDWRAI